MSHSRLLHMMAPGEGFAAFSASIAIAVSSRQGKMDF
jgi:hypothetical protein